jgi:hypothetical protein
MVRQRADRPITMLNWAGAGTAAAVLSAPRRVRSPRDLTGMGKQ